VYVVTSGVILYEHQHSLPMKATKPTHMMDIYVEFRRIFEFECWFWFQTHCIYREMRERERDGAGSKKEYFFVLFNRRKGQLTSYLLLTYFRVSYLRV